MATKSKRLGRGLSALLGDSPPKTEQSGEKGDKKVAANESQPTKITPQKLPIEFLSPTPLQPRQNFGEDQIKELADSIKEQGLLQPILVRATKKKDSFEIIAGERRWRAAQKAGLHDVPVVVRDLNDEETLQVAIIENVQRENLSPVEEARGYEKLIKDFKHKQDEIAKLVGKSRSHIANMLRVLTLPKDVLMLIDEGKISMGHARALVGTDNPSELAKEILKNELNVRDIEKVSSESKEKSSGKSGSKGKKSKSPKDADTLDLEKGISQALGLPVEIDHKGEKGGKLVIKYTSLEQLDDICGRLCGL